MPYNLFFFITIIDFTYFNRFMKNLITLVAILFGTISFAAAQQHRNCSTMQHLNRWAQANPKAYQKFLQKQADNRAYAAANPIQNRATIVIPVVVHVLYKNAAENISNAQVQSQIDVLNEDYRRMNADSVNTPNVFRLVAGKIDVQFVLALRDPQGNSTNGIVRKATTTQVFDDISENAKHNAQGGSDAWDTQKYLNLWCCDLGTSLLGYAQFPGAGNSDEDGVVAHVNNFGRNGSAQVPFELGRTCTHEIGHWLNLTHIWGDVTCGDDNIADTPTQETATGGCLTFPHVSCSNGPNGDMFMNYMDYSDDGCMNMFTKGQAAVMNATLSNFRAPIQTSNGAIPVTLVAIDASVVNITTLNNTLCGTTVRPAITFKNFGTTIITIAVINYTVDGGAPINYNYNGTLASLASTVLTLPLSGNLSIGAHTITVSIATINGIADPNASTANTQSQTVNIGGTQGGIIAAQNFLATTFPPAGYTLNNPDNGITWTRANVGKNAAGSAKMANYDYTNASGLKDDLTLPFADLTQYGGTPMLTFDVANAYYTNPATCTPANPCSYDTLVVLVSTDCGITFAEVYRKQKDLLATASFTTTAFVPTAAQWRNDTINLAAFAANNNVMIKFRNISNFENNTYLDNINIGQKYVATQNYNVAFAKFILQPNPAKGSTTLYYDATDYAQLNVEIYDWTGRLVRTTPQTVHQGTNQFTVNTVDLPAGAYNVTLHGAQVFGTQKLIIF